MKIFLVVFLSLSALVHSRPYIDRTYLPPSPEILSTEGPEPTPTYLPQDIDSTEQTETQTRIYLPPDIDSTVETETQTQLSNAAEIITSSSKIEDSTITEIATSSSKTEDSIIPEIVTSISKTEVSTIPEIVTSSSETEDTSTIVSITKDETTEKISDETLEITTNLIQDDLVSATTIKSNEIEQFSTQPSGVYLPPHKVVTTPIPRGDTGIVYLPPQKDNGKTLTGATQDKEGNVIPGKTKSGKGFISGEEKKIISKEREGHSLIPDQSYSSPGQDYFQFESPSKYKFGYEVNHPESLLNFGHHESRAEDTVTGGYFVLLPDGRKQIVEYVADKNGYHPRIHYESPARNLITNYDLKYNQQPQEFYKSVGNKDTPFPGPELVGNSRNHLPDMTY